MFKLNNLGGVLYKDDKEVMVFKFQRNMLVKCELLTDDIRLLPFELRHRNTDDFSVRKFFEERITPPTRDGINELLATTPVKYYDPERIIRYNKGRCIHDKYWVECDDDDTCWR